MPPAFARIILLSAVGLAAVASVWADDRLTTDTAAQGGRVGQFLVIPQVDVDALYNDNIYAQHDQKVSDEITRVRPGFVAASDWNRHALRVTAAGNLARYAVHRREDTDDYMVGAEGRVDVRRRTYVNAGASFTQDHEDRGDPNTPLSAVAPTVLTTAAAHVGATRELGRVNVTVDSRVEDVNYRNNRTADGVVIENNLRDRTRYAQTLRLGYVVTPGVETYVRGTLDTRVYAKKVPQDRSNHGGDVVAGTTLALSGKASADVYGGYTVRRYNSGLADVTTPVAGAKLNWQVDGLTTVQVGVDRSVEETIVGTNTADIRSGVEARVEHALTRHWLVHGEGGFAHHAYRGGGPRVDENFMQEGVGTTYYLNRYLAVHGDYTRIDRQISAVAGQTYGQDLLLVRLSATY